MNKKRVKDNFDPFKAFHDNEPPKTIAYYGSREDFANFAAVVCDTVNFETKRVVITGTVNGVVYQTITIFNPLRNPELIHK